MQISFSLPALLLVSGIVGLIIASLLIRRGGQRAVGPGAGRLLLGLGSIAIVAYSLCWLGLGRNPFSDPPMPETQWTVLYRQCKALEFNETKISIIKKAIESHPSKTLSPYILEKFIWSIKDSSHSTSCQDDAMIAELILLMTPYLEDLPNPTSQPSEAPQ